MIYYRLDRGPFGDDKFAEFLPARSKQFILTCERMYYYVTAFGANDHQAQA